MFTRIRKWAESLPEVAWLENFLAKHRWVEQDAAGVLVARATWAIFVRLSLFGAGIASAATVSTLTATSVPHLRMVTVPRSLAMETPTQRALVREGRRYGPGSGIVYVWGGSSPLGFDCSGYVNFVYRKVGISIPRDSRSQWTYGGTDVRRGHERPGDAVYFVGSTSGANAGPPPGHEGLYIGHGKFIQYYSGGKPAVVSRLRDYSDYMGAKRWYKPLQIPYRHHRTVYWVARHFRLKISHSRRFEITFKPDRHKMARWRFRAIRRWAHRHGHYFSGKRTYVTIKF